MKQSSRPARLARHSESLQLAIAVRGKSANHSVTRVYFLGFGKIGRSPTPKYNARICASPSILLRRTIQRSNGFEGAVLASRLIMTGRDARKLDAADLINDAYRLTHKAVSQLR
jgi:hypothetical protein